MPAKVFYNIEHIVGPNADPVKNIVMGPGDKNRVSRLRTKLSKSPSSSSRKYRVNQLFDFVVTFHYILLQKKTHFRVRCLGATALVTTGGLE